MNKGPTWAQAFALVGIVFSAGVIASEFRHQQHELDVVEARLAKKIEVQNAILQQLSQMQVCSSVAP